MVDVSQGTPTKRLWVIHPFLFSLYAVLALLAENKQEIPLDQAWRSLIILPLASLFLLLLLRLLLRDWYRAGLLATIIILIVTSYGHIYEVLQRVQIGAFMLGRHRYLLPPVVILLALSIWRIGIRRPNARFATRVLNLTAMVLLVFPVVNLAMFLGHIRGQGDPQSLNAIRLQTKLQPPKNAPLPDVYYIILDGYARSDYMLEYFGFDNSDFLDFLRSEGFYVAEKSNINHNWTSLSLASSLNMTFAQDLGLDLFPGTYPAIFADRISDSVVRQTLEGLGYTTVGFRTGYMNTEIVDADIFLAPDEVDLDRAIESSSMNAFESMLLRSSLGLVLWDITIGDIQTWTRTRTGEPFDLMRQIILYQFETLPEVAAMPEPTFTFVHIVSPHYPYIFDIEGEVVSQDGTFTFVEPPAATMGSEDAIMYRDQAIYITGKTHTLIEAILQRSDTTPIIILQADHGSGAAPGWMDLYSEGMAQRMAILNAYLLPPQCADDLYPSITPVNSFRVVFNCVYGGNLLLLEDLVYHSYWPRNRDYTFTLVNDELD